MPDYGQDNLGYRYERLKRCLQRIANNKIPGGKNARCRGQWFYIDKVRNIQKAAKLALK